MAVILNPLADNLRPLLKAGAELGERLMPSSSSCSTVRYQLRGFGALGFRCVAPDMRGYGRSSNYARHADYALEHSVDDMLELLAHLGRERAVWVGHDWGSPVVWSLASHYPERCEAIANLCVPYIADGFAPGNLIALVNREIYPEAEFMYQESAPKKPVRASAAA
jgi:pimeloyl-ACP methyl ester carboxylesterase